MERRRLPFGSRFLEQICHLLFSAPFLFQIREAFHGGFGEECVVRIRGNRLGEEWFFLQDEFENIFVSRQLLAIGKVSLFPICVGAKAPLAKACKRQIVLLIFLRLSFILVGSLL